MADSIVDDFDARLTPDERALVERAKEFGRDVVAPNSAQWEYERRYPQDAIGAACALGLGSIELSADFGGLGLRFSAKGNWTKRSTNSRTPADWPPATPTHSTTSASP